MNFGEVVCITSEMPLNIEFLSLIYVQMLEVIRLEGHAVGQEDPFVSRDIHLLQVHT